MLPKINPTGTVAWEKLRRHFFEMQYVKMQELFAEDTARTQKMHLKWNDFLLDYSKNRITQETLELLFELADEVKLKQGIDAMFLGNTINETEKRCVQHTALRDIVKQENLPCQKEIEETLKTIEHFTELVIAGILKGATNKAFTDVVNIGIGGSDLGPKMVVEALTDYHNHLKTHFVSNIDKDAIISLLEQLNPETTLIIVVSKSFTTLETLENALVFKEWLSSHQLAVEQHLIAVSSNIEAAMHFGVLRKNIFPMWDFVGGRFSLWGAVGISIALAIGFVRFKELLSGAYAMDQHFKTADYKENIPVILALLSIWYNNFYGFETEAVIPYANRLQSLPAYLQQVMMESNGKNIDREGLPVNYQTGTIIWGEIGTNSQHAFFQLFHQGTKVIPTDFIGFVKPFHDSEMHDLLMANFFAQTEALMNGKEDEDTKLTIDVNAAFKTFEGNRPSNTLLIEKLTPKNLGSLLAMYEHKTFVQGLIWNIYSFDQFGVEYGKVLANVIKKELTDGTIGSHDASTRFLLTSYLNMKKND